MESDGLGYWMCAVPYCGGRGGYIVGRVALCGRCFEEIEVRKRETVESMGGRLRAAKMAVLHSVQGVT